MTMQSYLFGIGKPQPEVIERLVDVFGYVAIVIEEVAGAVCEALRV